MKIGIITYVKCDNYGAELQAYALQWYLNKLGYNAEVINLEKREIDLKRSPRVIVRAILMRFKHQGFKAFSSIYRKSVDTFTKIRVQEKSKSQIEKKHILFERFFEKYIRHSEKYYTLDEISSSNDLDYDIYIAGSDQIWNYIHTDRLDVYFLMFANKYKAKKISYAASISINDIPKRLRNKYGRYLKNIDYLSVRELQGAELIKRYWNLQAEVVLDPTLLITKEEWARDIANSPKVDGDYLLIYTLSGSSNIRTLAKSIAQKKNLIIVNIKSNFVKEPDDGIIHFNEVGPQEWIGLWLNAKYVVTDSFHGTAFSINFNIPFTTLVNPVSTMNSRVLSILKITGLESRIAYDYQKVIDIPDNLSIDYDNVNHIIEDWRNKSTNYIIKSLS